MTNIFENAYFGKAYKTRDGRKALYIYQVNNDHLLYIEGETCPDSYPSSGLLLEKFPEFDIISEWQEEVDEEVLDKLAEDYFLNTYNNGVKDPNLEIINEKKFAVADFKAGYRKAKEL